MALFLHTPFYLRYPGRIATDLPQSFVNLPEAVHVPPMMLTLTIPSITRLYAHCLSVLRVMLGIRLADASESKPDWSKSVAVSCDPAMTYGFNLTSSSNIKLPIFLLACNNIHISTQGT
mgnify:FL=1